MMQGSDFVFRSFSHRSHRGKNAERFQWSLLSPKVWHQWIALLALSVLWLVLPIVVRDKLAAFIGGYLAEHRWSRRIPQNLERCFPHMPAPEKQAIVLEYCKMQACVIFDLPALWLSSAKQQRKRVRFQGLHHIEKNYQQGKPVCLLVCHSLGLEHAARALKWSYPLLGYYRPFGAPVVDWLFYRFRSRNGGYLLKRGDSLRPLLKDMRDGWMLYMMIDEDMGPREGIWAPFFATEKCGIKAPSKISLLTNASALPVYSWYNAEEKCYEVQILPALDNFPSSDEKSDVEVLMRCLQTMIDIRPGQYGWRQQLFRSAQN